MRAVESAVRVLLNFDDVVTISSRCLQSACLSFGCAGATGKDAGHHHRARIAHHPDQHHQEAWRTTLSGVSLHHVDAGEV